MSYQLSTTSVPLVRPTGDKPWRRAARRCYRFLDAAFAVRRERNCLASLDDRALADIGLSRSLADREAGRDFLDVPEHRVRRD